MSNNVAELNITFVSVTGCSRDGLDVYRPLAAPPVRAPGRERAEEELLRREAVARPDRHRRRHCRCRLPSNNNVLLCRLFFHLLSTKSHKIVQLYSPPGTLRPSRPSRGPCLRSGECGGGQVHKKSGRSRRCSTAFCVSYQVLISMCL